MHFVELKKKIRVKRCESTRSRTFRKFGYSITEIHRDLPYFEQPNDALTDSVLLSIGERNV